MRLIADLGNQRVYASPPRLIRGFVNVYVSVPVTGAIEPLNKTEYVKGISFEMPASYWRSDLYDRMQVIGATTFTAPNLHDAGHLYTRLFAGKSEGDDIGVLAHDPSLFKVRNSQGFGVTLMAFAACTPKVIQYVLAHGGDAKARTPSGLTIMHMAAINPRPGTDDLALKRGGDVNAKTKPGRTPLMRAIVYGTPGTWRWLLAHGANPNYEAGPGFTVAQYAIREGQTQAIPDLVKAGVNPRSRDSFGQGWYDYAVFNYTMMDTIRANGVPIDAINPKTGETALMTAAWAGIEESEVWLLRHGANPDLRDREGPPTTMRRFVTPSTPIASSVGSSVNTQPTKADFEVDVESRVANYSPIRTR